MVEELDHQIYIELQYEVPKPQYETQYEAVKQIRFPDAPTLASIRADIMKKNARLIKRQEMEVKTTRSLAMAKTIVGGKRPEPMPCAGSISNLQLRQPKSDSLYLFAVDVESFEKNHSIILELGWIIFDVGKQRFYNRHIVIKEYQHVRNFKFVPDHKENFMFGETEYLTEREAIRVLQNEFDTLAPNMALICHGLSSELSYFKKMKLKLRHSYEFDTNELHQCVSDEFGRSISLINLLNKYNIQHQYLHNAGKIS